MRWHGGLLLGPRTCSPSRLPGLGGTGQGQIGQRRLTTRSSGAPTACHQSYEQSACWRLSLWHCALRNQCAARPSGELPWLYVSQGAALSTNSVVPTSAFKVTAGADLISEHESRPNRRKCFCSKCGTQLFMRRTNRPEYTVITMGTMDGELQERPERHVFVESKAGWHTITDKLP